MKIDTNKKNTRDSSALILKDITKVYANGTVALQNLNLTVAEGEFVSLVGASGCGKSTLLRAIAGLEKISSGEIKWSKKYLARKLAFVFQEPVLMPWAKAIDNVALPLKLSGVPQSKAKVRCADAINLVGLKGFENVYPRQLSGGMKMRVSLARALVTQPRIMLMDEPFGSLDEMTRSKLNQDLLRLWQQQNWMVIFVTHNIYEAVYLSNRVLVIAPSPGRVVADIPIEAIYPRNEDFRTSRLCNEYCREILTRLQAAEQENPFTSSKVRGPRYS